MRLDEMNRRDFIRKTTGGLAGLAAGGGIPQLLGATLNLDVPDSVLMKTPEERWIDKIPAKRLYNILSNTDYLNGELAAKMYDVAVYGLGNAQYTQVLKMMLDAIKKTGGDPVTTIAKSLTSKNGEWILKNDFAWADMPEGSYVNNILQSLKSAGVEIPEDLKKNIWRRYHKSTEKGKQRSNKPKDKPKNKPKDKKWDASNSSSMHQSFESKLNSALLLV